MWAIPPPVARVEPACGVSARNPNTAIKMTGRLRRKVARSPAPVRKLLESKSISIPRLTALTILNTPCRRFGFRLGTFFARDEHNNRGTLGVRNSRRRIEVCVTIMRSQALPHVRFPGKSVAIFPHFSVQKPVNDACNQPRLRTTNNTITAAGPTRGVHRGHKERISQNPTARRSPSRMRTLGKYRFP